MKAIKENIAALKKMGFTNEDNDPSGSWRSEDGWVFHMSNVPSIKELTKTLYKYYYEIGYGDGQDGYKCLYKYDREYKIDHY